MGISSVEKNEGGAGKSYRSENREAILSAVVDDGLLVKLKF